MSTSAPTRRLVLGTFAALPLAGLPAVLPLPATPNPDAELIAACAVSDEYDRRCRYIYDEMGVDDETANELVGEILDRHLYVVDAIEAHRATTALGILARARSLAVHNLDCAWDMDPRNGTILAIITNTNLESA